MTICKLYIIGNGFDINHNLDTCYDGYKRYLEDTDITLFNNFKYFPYLSYKTSPWKDIEESLAIDYEDFMEDMINDGYPDIINDDSDSRWYNIEINIQEITKVIDNFTCKYFIDWLKKIDISIVNKKFRITNKNLFLSFNYTELLEKKYNIKKENILHIHGCLVNLKENYTNADIRKEIQFGAVGISKSEVFNELKKRYETDDFYGVSIEPGINELIHFIDYSTKNLEQNYDKLKKFISTRNINKVVVMGHSLNGADEEYYSNIIIPLLEKNKWVFYKHNEEDELAINNFINKHKIRKYKIKKW